MLPFQALLSKRNLINQTCGALHCHSHHCFLLALHLYKLPKILDLRPKIKQIERQLSIQGCREETFKSVARLKATGFGYSHTYNYIITLHAIPENCNCKFQLLYIQFLLVCGGKCNQKSCGKDCVQSLVCKDGSIYCGSSFCGQQSTSSASDGVYSEFEEHLHLLFIHFRLIYSAFHSLKRRSPRNPAVQNIRNAIIKPILEHNVRDEENNKR